MERSESSKGKKNQKGQDNSHAETASWEQILGPRRNPRGKKKIPPLGEGYCMCSGSKEAVWAKGLPHLLGLSRKSSFSSVRVQQTSCFLCPRAASPLGTGQAGHWGLAATVASCRALAQTYLVNTTALIISCFTSLLGFFPYALRKRSCPSFCPQIQMLFYGGLHGNLYLFLIPTCGIIHF